MNVLALPFIPDQNGIIDTTKGNDINLCRNMVDTTHHPTGDPLPIECDTHHTDVSLNTPSNTQTQNIELNSYTSLNDLRCKNMNKIIFGQLNINSIRNKFDILKDMISGKVDILLLC